MAFSISDIIDAFVPSTLKEMHFFAENKDKKVKTLKISIVCILKLPRRKLIVFKIYFY